MERPTLREMGIQFGEVRQKYIAPLSQEDAVKIAIRVFRDVGIDPKYSGIALHNLARCFVSYEKHLDLHKDGNENTQVFYTHAASLLGDLMKLKLHILEKYGRVAWKAIVETETTIIPMISYACKIVGADESLYK